MKTGKTNLAPIIRVTRFPADKSASCMDNKVKQKRNCGVFRHLDSDENGTGHNHLWPVEAHKHTAARPQTPQNTPRRLHPLDIDARALYASFPSAVLRLRGMESSSRPGSKYWRHS